MPAAFFGAGLPTLSEVVSASFDHLLGAADYYDGAGELTENAFTRLRDPRAGPAAPSGMARRPGCIAAQRLEAPPQRAG
ncbi:MAG TPA: hypothetical protein VEF72_25865 [Mycobacterium sp.]|nr:hypothetical protein [Mycobacterium sp.]